MFLKVPTVLLQQEPSFCCHPNPAASVFRIHLRPADALAAASIFGRRQRPALIQKYAYSAFMEYYMEYDRGEADLYGVLSPLWSMTAFATIGSMTMEFSAFATRSLRLALLHLPVRDRRGF